MLSSQFFKRYVSLLILVEMKGSFAQFTVNEMTEMCSRVPSFESGHSEISDQIQSQNKILGKLAESIQTVHTEIKNLSREVESKLESVQLGYSELRSEIDQLRNLTINSSHKVESKIKNLSREVESKIESVQLQNLELKSESKSSLKNLSQEVGLNTLNIKNLSREVESKLESILFGHSELKSQIEQLENLTTNCSTVRTTQVFTIFFIQPV